MIWLTAAVRSTSFLLLRMKQASASSILRSSSANKNRHYDGQLQKLLSVCADQSFKRALVKIVWKSYSQWKQSAFFSDVMGSHEDVAAFIPCRKLMQWWHWLISHYNTAAIKSLRTIMGVRHVVGTYCWDKSGQLTIICSLWWKQTTDDFFV